MDGNGRKKMYGSGEKGLIDRIRIETEAEGPTLVQYLNSSKRIGIFLQNYKIINFLTFEKKLLYSNKIDRVKLNI